MAMVCEKLTGREFPRPWRWLKNLRIFQGAGYLEKVPEKESSAGDLQC